MVFIYNIVTAWLNGEPAEGDPWDGRTLEWTIASPPPEYNFAEIPTVTGIDDWWIKKRTANAEVEPTDGVDPHSIHLPQPSYWPFVVSVGLLIGGYGLIYNIGVAILGAVISMIAVYAWSFEPVNDPDESTEH